MTELDNNVPPASNFGILTHAIKFEKEHGWHSVLTPVSDLVAAVSMLIASDTGDFLVTAVRYADKRWIWLSPEAFQHLVKNGFQLVEASVDMDHISILSDYWTILDELGRDRKTGRRKDA